MKNIISKKIRNSARGEDCCFRIVGICNFDTETTVLCHLSDGAKGMGCKSCDLTSAAYGCSACHDAVDRRAWSQELEDNREWYLRRAMVRTWRKLIEQGLVKIL